MIDHDAVYAKVMNKGKLRATKPKVAEGSMTDGCAVYVWRMASFLVSKNSKLQCMPCTADFDIPVRDYQERRAITKELDVIVNQIVDSVPKSEWHGVRRWGRALGQI